MMAHCFSSAEVIFDAFGGFLLADRVAAFFSGALIGADFFAGFFTAAFATGFTVFAADAFLGAAAADLAVREADLAAGRDGEMGNLNQ